METCFNKIKNTIQNRSSACNKLNDEELKNAFENRLKSKNGLQCNKAIEKYKKRILCCGSNISLRQKNNMSRLKKLYFINSLFK